MPFFPSIYTPELKKKTPKNRIYIWSYLSIDLYNYGEGLSTWETVGKWSKSRGGSRRGNPSNFATRGPIDLISFLLARYDDILASLKKWASCEVSQKRKCAQSSYPPHIAVVFFTQSQVYIFFAETKKYEIFTFPKKWIHFSPGKKMGSDFISI